MEAVSLVNSRGLKLAGLFHAGTLDSIIVMGHGFTGDKSECGGFDRIAEEFNKAGYNVFRFDYAGCGESDDAPLSVSRHREDYVAVLDYVESRGFSRIGFFGHSISGLVALEVMDPRVKALVFTAPVTAPMQDYAEKKYDESQLEELQETGFITRYRDKGPRYKSVIDGKSIDERKEVDQTKLLGKLNIPVLVFYGKLDVWVPYENSVEAMTLFPHAQGLSLSKKRATI
ncbi:MAG: alpha/beta fold hydrolase [Candidatus Woesearchaeota archaeon]